MSHSHIPVCDFAGMSLSSAVPGHAPSPAPGSLAVHQEPALAAGLDRCGWSGMPAWMWRASFRHQHRALITSSRDWEAGIQTVGSVGEGSRGLCLWRVLKPGTDDSTDGNPGSCRRWGAQLSNQVFNAQHPDGSEYPLVTRQAGSTLILHSVFHLPLLCT